MHPKAAIFFPGGPADLLSQEIVLALKGLGHKVLQPDPATNSPLENVPGAWLERMKQEKAALFFCVNFKALHGKPVLLRRLLEDGPPVAVWCVDNPWNLLSGVQGPEWKEVFLFVTDKSFVRPLQEAGAKKVFHLPLAACPYSMGPNPQRDRLFPPPPDIKKLCFVGRPAFPGKEAFFAGLELPPGLLRQALALLRQGQRPHFAWWLDALGLRNAALWPGKNARLPAFGAQECNRALRTRALSLLEDHGLTIFGEPQNPPVLPPGHLPPHVPDAAPEASPDYAPQAAPNSAQNSAPNAAPNSNSWRALLPHARDLRPAVDYYARLPGIYANAEFSLDLTSLLLPEGLTQRNFDVWAAGGFCLGDRNPGQEIFPAELVEASSFRTPAEAAALAEYYRANPAHKKQLQQGWRQHILSHHNYQQRLNQALELIFS